jgi:hypothetical protein
MAKLRDRLRVKCTFCQYVWIANFPPGANAERLECPRCGRFASRPYGSGKDPQEDKEIAD